MDVIRFVFLSVLMMMSSFVYAGRDPIGWSQSGTIPATTELNHSYSVNFTLTNNLPFTMPTQLDISNNSTPSSEVTMVDDCTGLKLTPGQTCTVGLVLIPKSVGKKYLSVFMEYGKNKVKIPSTTIVTQTNAAAASSLAGVASPGFPTAIHSSTSYTLGFTFTNNTSSALSGLSLSQAAGNSSGYTQSSTTCSATLAAGASCVVTGSFSTAATSGTAQVGYTYSNGTLSASPVTSTIVSDSTAGATRTITFTNNCSQTVYFGLVGGAVNTNPCTTQADCSNGSYCDPAANAGAGECFYGNPVPANNTYTLINGASNTVQITDYNLQYVWSGNMAARTGASCGTGACDTGDCGGTSGNTACPVGHGFDQPATLAEITMLRGSIDSYDVSILNGTNVAIQMTPTTSYTFNPSGISPSEYNCTSPGKTTQTNGLGNCPWTFTPPANFPTAGSAYKYKYVKPEVPTKGLNCTNDTPCTTPSTVCGLYYDKTASPTTLKSYCGTLIGYNTANQVCSFANTNQNVPNSGNNLGDPFFDCDTAISGGTGNLASFTNWAMFACQAQSNGDLGTCYNTSANPPASTTDCCGCVNWQSVGGGIVVPSSTTTCVAVNTAWTSGVQTGVQWLKLGCPTAYVYPFDDKSGGFGCDDIQGSHTTNTVNYTVTFCPA